jgi:DNA-binding YbaB/EbfC family protein
MDMNKIMEMAAQMKTQLEGAQNEVANMRVRGEAGGGMVAVTMTGRFEVVEIKIEPSAMTDKQLLEDLLRAAFNQAVANANDAMKSKMGNLAGGMGMDLSAFGL